MDKPINEITVKIKNFILFILRKKVEIIRKIRYEKYFFNVALCTCREYNIECEILFLCDLCL